MKKTNPAEGDLKNNYRRRRLAAAVSALLLAAAAAVFVPAAEAEASAQKLSPLTVSVLKIGKADAIILTEGNHTMVIDAGEEDDGGEVTEFLLKQGITSVETLIITHFDKDHLGGADTLVKYIGAERVLLPDYEGSGTQYQEFLQALKEKDIVPERLDEPCSFSLGSAGVYVEPPSSYETKDPGEEYDNDFSLITTVTHGDMRFVFAGDIEEQRIREWLEGESAVSCDFLKVPHHGVYDDALAELFAKLSPSTAVICSSAKNPADPRTLELLKNGGADVRETKDGRITVISDGQSLDVKQKTKK